MRRKKPTQYEMKYPTWGGARKGAGRPRGVRPKVAHRRRAHLDTNHPVLVTIRFARRNMRTGRVLDAIEAVLRTLHEARGDFRVTDYSIQDDHLHLIVEADASEALSSGMAALGIRLARRINKVMGTRGRVFADRHHRKPLGSPAEVRNAKAYVVLNRRRHCAKAREPLEHGIDRFSSGAWFTGWTVRVEAPPGRVCPVADPETWLGRFGWRRRGLIAPWEIPGRRHSRRPSRRTQSTSRVVAVTNRRLVRLPG